MFEEITAQRTKESIVTTYAEVLNQIRDIPGYSDLDEKGLLTKFENELVKTGKLPAFVKDSLKSMIKAKADYDKDTITVTEVNKVLKDARNILSEIKEYKYKDLGNAASKRLNLTYGENKTAEIINYDGKVYLIDSSNKKGYELDGDKHKQVKLEDIKLSDLSKYSSLKIDEKLILAAKKALDTKDIYL